MADRAQQPTEPQAVQEYAAGGHEVRVLDALLPAVHPAGTAPHPV